ncbi:hypothetical protein [Ideonella livida]|uniref:Uncharacterized protein n=1 Tax=Ideonella livida TaxID=2707176 RepID=A0A7C9TM94_9BURK|nr:hypothetical protein [Ideonella livida]NDY92803.1 hypothetical protein [Ideonella livida]
MRSTCNLPGLRQRALARQFHWLPAVHDLRPVPGLRHMALSVFDHWLTEAEARQALVHVPMAEQQRRDRQLWGWALDCAAQTEWLDFRFKGRRQQQLRLRAYTSAQALAMAWRPPSLGGGRRPLRHALLPQQQAVVYEGHDHTWALVLPDPQDLAPWRLAAARHGLHLLPG